MMIARVNSDKLQMIRNLQQRSSILLLIGDRYLSDDSLKLTVTIYQVINGT